MLIMGVLLQYALGRLDAVDPGHLDVHPDHVGHELPRPVHRLLAGRRFPHYPDILYRFQYSADAFTEQGVVIGQQDLHRLQYTPPLMGCAGWPRSRCQERSPPSCCLR